MEPIESAGFRERVQKFSRNLFVWSLVALVAGYTLIAWIMVAAHLILDNSSGIVGYVGELVYVMILSSLILLPLCLLARRRWLAAIQLPMVALALIWYVPYFVPKSTAAPSGAQTLTVVTFNVYYENRDFDALEAVVREADADVVAFQEFTAPIEAALSERLVDLYPEQAYDPNFAKGLFSKYPLDEVEYWRPNFNGHQRALLRLDDGQEVAIYNVHPAPLIVPNAFARRDQDIDTTLTHIAEEPAERPVILLGDFNSGDRSAVYERLAAQFHDAWRSAGQGFGFSHMIRGMWIPLIRLDYVFYSGDIAAVEASLLDRVGSDHRPLRVVLAIGE